MIWIHSKQTQNCPSLVLMHFPPLNFPSRALAQRDKHKTMSQGSSGKVKSHSTDCGSKTNITNTVITMIPAIFLAKFSAMENNYFRISKSVSQNWFGHFRYLVLPHLNTNREKYTHWKCKNKNINKAINVINIKLKYYFML